MMRTASMVALLGAVYGSAGPASGQQPDRIDVDAPVATARRTSESIRIDGRLDEVAWQSADPIGPLRQREPIEDDEPSEQTLVRVLYNDTALYIAVVCRDRSPREIV